MQVNYVAEMNAFFSWMTEAEPSAFAQLLWHALMSVANSRGDGNEWPETFCVSNRNLLLRLPYSEDTLSRAREELAALGRIRYTPGTRTQRPCYRILFFGEDAENRMPRACSADEPQEAPLPADEPAEVFQTETETYTHTDEEDCRCSLKEAARAACAKVMKQPPRDAALRRLVNAAQDFHASPELLREAISQAAENNAANPLRYAQALLQGWREAGYETPEDVLDGQVLRYRETWRAAAPLEEPIPQWLREGR